MEVFELFSKNYNREKQDRISLQDYLLACRDDPTMYATASERMIAAIGKPEIFDTSIDPRFGRIFFNRTIKRYPAFSDFYGMEETIERIVGYFKYAAQGLEEARQILYLLGPVGGGKSSLAERLKTLMEVNPIYVLAAGDQVSPVFESPLALFHPDRMGDVLQDKYGVERRRLKGLMSPWAVKRLDEFSGDISNFDVVRLLPSKIRQIAITKTEPGDENNQDIASLVGKVDIRKLEHYSQNDPDAYRAPRKIPAVFPDRIESGISDVWIGGTSHGPEGFFRHRAAVCRAGREERPAGEDRRGCSVGRLPAASRGGMAQADRGTEVAGRA